MGLSPKSLVMDLLSTMPVGRTVPVGSLVRAASILGIGDNSLRVALARLRAQGLVESADRGHYRLSRGALPIDRRVRSWHSLEAELIRWDGSWVGLQLAASGERSTAPRRARAVRLLGFRQLDDGLHLRPNNLTGGTGAVRERLLSLEPDIPATVLHVSELDPDTDSRARDLWDSLTLERGYDAMVDELNASTLRLGTLDEEQAMAESFLLGGEALRMIVQDPWLPAPIIDTARRAALVKTMRRYHRLGLRAWRGWAGEAVKLQQSPADVWRQDDLQGAAS